MNTLMMSLCRALAVCCCVLLQNNVKVALNVAFKKIRYVSDSVPHLKVA